MKFTISTLILLIFLFSYCNGQKSRHSFDETPVKLDSLTNSLIYTEVINVGGVSKNDLEQRGGIFLLNQFTKDNSKVVKNQINDSTTSYAANGRVNLDMSKYLLAGIITGGQQMSCELSLELIIKNGRYKYIISDITLVNEVTKVKTRIDEGIRKNPESFKQRMERGLSNSQFQKYMGERNFVMNFIRDMKQAMNSGSNEKYDF